MALRHADGFGHYGSSQYTDVYDTGFFGATLSIGAYGPSGRPGLRFTGDYNDSVDRGPLVTSGAAFALQGDFRISTAPPTANVILGPTLASGGLQCSLVLNTNRTLRVYRGSASGTPLGSASSYVVPLNTHIHVGFKGTIDNAAGTAEVHIWEDGDVAPQVVITLSGADTQAEASATWDYFDLGAGCSGTTDWANVVAMDGWGATLNDLLGPVDCWTLFASARVASDRTAWSLSAGSSIAALLDDATPDDDATYCEESTQNDEVSVAVDPIPFPGRTIRGAQLYASAKKTSGSPTVKALARESSTSYLGSNVSPGVNYAYVQQPYSAMPSGSAFSTAAAFDALQWGLALTSAGTTARLTQVAVVVILDRQQGRRNLLTGYQHTVTGDDNLAAGQSNSVDGAVSEAHGTNVSVVGNRSVAFNLDGVPRTLSGDGKFWINGEEVTAGSVAGPGSSTDNAIARFDGAGGSTLQDSAITVDDSGALGLPDNVRQTFNPGATNAGLNVGSIAGDPSAPSNGDLWYDSSAGELTARIAGVNVALGSGSGGTAVGVIGITIDGAGLPITTGVKGFVVVPWTGTITKSTLLSTDAAATAGSIVIDVWKDTFANYPPTVSDTITAAAKPTLSSANQSLDSTLTGWTTSVTAGDVLGFKVDSASTVTRVVLALEVSHS